MIGHSNLSGQPQTERETALDPLLLDPDGPSVVVIGGGHGQAAVLEAIQLYAGHITAVVSVADDGGSSGRLTTAMAIPAPGDIRRCLLALSSEPSLVAELFAHRFRSGDVSDHSLGNLMLAALHDIYGDFESGVEAAGRMLRTLGDVVPATTTPVTLTAVIEGRTVGGQALIASTRGRVDSISLSPSDVTASHRALDAIAGADQIILGPGSLFTSVIAALLVPGLSPAVMASAGQRVFVANLVDQDGETWGLDGAGHLEALARFGGVAGPGIVLTHEGSLDVPEGHQRITFNEGDIGEWTVRSAEVADRNADWPAHDPFALSRALEGLLH